MSKTPPPTRSAARKPAYRNPALPAAKRVKDLLARMTIEEKAAQMMCVWQKKAETLVDEKGNFDRAKARKAFRHGRGLGQVGRPSDAGGARDSADNRTARTMAELTNDIQKFFLEHSRLGIPVIFHEECLHGHAAIGGDSFPQPIGLAATFDPELVESLFAMTAAEARAARGAPGADAGGGCGSRSALGPGGRDLRRRSVPGVAHGRRRGARFSGRRHIPR